MIIFKSKRIKALESEVEFLNEKIESDRKELWKIKYELWAMQKLLKIKIKTISPEVIAVKEED